MDINAPPEKVRQNSSSDYASEKQSSHSKAKQAYQRHQLEDQNEHRRAEDIATNTQKADHNQAYQYEAKSDRLSQDLEGFDTKIKLREPRIEGMESFDANNPNNPKLLLQANKPEIPGPFLQPNRTSRDIGKFVINEKTGVAGWKPPDFGKAYWIPRYHIYTEILGNEIHSLAGPRATFRSLTFKNQNGFLIQTADKVMSSGDIERLRHESVKYKRFDEDDQEEPPDPEPYTAADLNPAIWLAGSKRDTAKGSFSWAPLSGFTYPAPEQHTQSRRKMDLASSDQAQTTDLYFEASIPKSKLDDVDKKCGVVVEGGGPCERDLMCPVHSEERKNAVPGRSEPYRVLKMRAQAKWESSSLESASEPITRLTINKGDHLELKEEEKKNLPYILEKNLGLGGSASVEMVRDINTNSVFARKIIRNVYTRNLDAVKLSFLNEVRVMRLLASHHHIIQVFATYIAQRELALILSPVADGGDLHDFLGRYQDAGIHAPGHGEETLILRRAFGCLVSGLAFMHEQRVRHKDIKPQNILVHQGSVLYTDFGISLDFSKQGQSTTIGNPHSYTKRYCAPEVADWGNRNSKSDIFSLGCVFIEIIAALQPSLIADALLEGPYHQKLSEQELACYFAGVLDHQFSDDFVLALTGMVHPDPNARPKAANLKDILCTVRSGFNMFCDLCANTKDVRESEKDNQSVDERATSPTPTPTPVVE